MAVNLLVTGGTGFVGSHVVDTALEKNYRVRVFAKADSEGIEELLSRGVEVIIGDLRNDSEIEQAIDGMDVVVHCAAQVGEMGNEISYAETNVNSCGQIIRSSQRHSIKKLVFISSQGVYEARDHFGTIETEMFPLESLDFYTKSKAISEKLFANAMQNKEIPGVILRPGFIYGARDRQLLPRVVSALRQKKVAFWGSGQKLINNTYIENLIQAIFLAIESEKRSGEIYNIADRRRIDRRHFFRTVSQEASVPKPRLHIPPPIFRKILDICEFLTAYLKLQSPLLVSKARYKFLAVNLDYSIAKAIEELGYDPKYSFDEGMKKTILWFLANEKNI